MALGKDQKEFIRAKVKFLGSLEKVRKHYFREDKVCKFAIEFAEKLKLPETKVEITRRKRRK